jgi:hypothetical protein
METMPTARKLLAGLALAIMTVSCTDKGPTDANTVTDNQTNGAPTAPQTGKAVLYGVAHAQSFTADGSGSLPAGKVVRVAKVQITKFYYEDGVLYVDGGLFAPNRTLISSFSHVAATLTSAGGPTQPTCPILVLDIGAIHLDLLGLVVDLAPVHLNISAQSGAGNLLGNLLCAVANLLNGGGLATQIQTLLTQLNALLAALLAAL